MMTDLSGSRGHVAGRGDGAEQGSVLEEQGADRAREAGAEGGVIGADERGDRIDDAASERETRGARCDVERLEDEADLARAALRDHPPFEASAGLALGSLDFQLGDRDTKRQEQVRQNVTGIRGHRGSTKQHPCRPPVGPVAHRS